MSDKTLEQIYAEHEGKVSDKWSIYLSEYGRILDEYRHRPIRMLEIGVQNGGSLDIWSEYFSGAQNIIGCDINSECGRLSFTDPRISVVVGDANSDAVQATITALAPVLDLVIDDGSHTSGDIVKSFARYFPRLADDGLFVAEDLHCSYWREFGGGLYHPYSSLTFFKHLADVINHEHWGVAKAPGDILKGFAVQHGFDLPEDELAKIHSIEFVNSMCVVRKAPPERNRLGRRVIVGETALMNVPGSAGFKNTESSDGIRPSQSGNEWSTRTMSPGEELLLVLQELAEVKTGLAAAERALNMVRQSTSWKITKPLRWLTERWRQIKNATPAPSAPREKVAPSVPSAPGLGFREKLIFKGHVFYRQRIKGTAFGPLVSRSLLRLGLVSSRQLQNSALALDGDVSSWWEIPDLEELHLRTELGVPSLNLSQPLNFEVSPCHADRPCINVLLPSLLLKHMSGGPNTALLLAANLVAQGESVRLIGCDASAEGREAELHPHMEKIFGRRINRERVTLVDGMDRSRPIAIGANDLFLATAWWTAQIAKHAVRKTNHDQFIYLIQDFEPILHEGSTFQAKALETYGLPHIPVINTKLLLDHLVKEGCGCYAGADFAREALFFEPAIDRGRYFPDHAGPERQEGPRKRVLLFYARPQTGRRNLFEIGLFALRRAVAAGFLGGEGWEIWGMGEKMDPVHLGKGVYLNPLPWMDFDSYARRVRTADLLLSLMLSPHPSYPPLEMAASGKLAVTNSFSVKTAERLRDLSPNIVAAEPNPDSVADVLERVAGRINSGLPSYDPAGAINLPGDWDQSLAGLIPRLKERIDAVREGPSRAVPVISKGLPADPASDYERFRRRRLVQRRRNGRYEQQPGLFSLVTTVFDTKPEYLVELADSVFMQDGGTNFEWLILDNGSTRGETTETLRHLSGHPCVRLERVAANQGIIGGLRLCLEQAKGRYILPVDSDDLLEPDCVQVLTRTLREAGYPPLLYTDEDKLAGERFIQPYFKPDWDPVLFVHSCYIAHLCAIDRQKALELELYTDAGAEGCHDWDSFFRFMMAGRSPLHLPEVLYTWRAHELSTAGNIKSKAYISDSHRMVLQRFLDQAGAPHVELTFSKFFSHQVDWWLRRKREQPQSMLSVVIGRETAREQGGGGPQGEAVWFDPAQGLARLAEIVEQSGAALVHLCRQGVRPDDDEWYWDAMGLMELFPDTAVVGGMLHDGHKVTGGPAIFGFGQGCDCPDRGRPLSDPGYFAQMWKPHSVSAVSGGHCVARSGFLKNALAQMAGEQAPLNLLGPWLGGLAAEAGQRVVFSPFMRAAAERLPEDQATSHERARFLSRFWRLLPERRLLSPNLGLDAATAYAPVSRDRRQGHLAALQQHALPYADWFARELPQRAERYPAPRDPAPISLLTAVYHQSDQAQLEQLAASITEQTMRPAEWIMVLNGPFPAERLERLKAQARDQWGATLIEEPREVGIIGALRLGLEKARGQYVAVVDADDLLTPDAIQILACQIERFDQPDLIFSDEDQLVGGRPAAPYLRACFDPVLNLESSYIWHLLAIKRNAALEQGLYSDSGANWCQDWDSVMRIAGGGGRLEHCPEVLYHWRQHSGSTTNKPHGDPRSLDSVRHVLQGRIERSATPELFAVETWPLDRGGRELYIAQPRVDLSAFSWVGDYRDGQAPGGPPQGDFLVVNGAGVAIEDQGVFHEAARLFGLHPNLGAVGGRVVDDKGLIVEGCFVSDGAGGVAGPWVGRAASYAGPYALALKPQSVLSTGPSLAIFRLSALQEVGAAPPGELAALYSWVLATCERLGEAKWGVAFSPLVQGRATGPWPPMALAERRPRPAAKGAPAALARYGVHCPYAFT